VCEPTETIELIRSFTNFLYGILKSVWLVSVCAQEGIDYPLEEASSCAVGVEDADRRYRHRQGGVVFNLTQTQQQPQLHVRNAYQLSKPLLRPLLLGV
jgi:hypothetical protein